MVAILNRLFLQRFTWICSLFFFFILGGYAQDTIHVAGTDSSWANVRVQVWYFKDYISRDPFEFEDVVADNNGAFEFEFVSENTLQLFIASGALEGSVFVQPGDKYELNLPKWRGISRVDSLNPFYEPVRFFYGLNNSYGEELNHLIAEFDYLYEDYLATNFNDIRRRRRGSGVDDMVHFLDSLFRPVDSIAFFSGYKKYRIAKLLSIAYLHDDNYLTRDYFLNKEILYHNPAYFELFNDVFGNYLEAFMRTRDGANIGYDIARAKSYGRAMATLSNNLALRNDTLRELVLIKGLRDALYKNTFPKSTIFQTLDSVRLQTKVAEHKAIVNSVVSRATTFRKGYEPPNFRITERESVVFEFPFKGKRFVLLNFIDVESFEVQKELPLLSMLNEKHKEVLEVISINVGSSFGTAQSYFNDNKFQWALFNGNTLDGIRDLYRIKSFPAYFLVDGNGKLVMHPTPTPANNFEWYFFKIIKQRQREQYRNQ